MKKILILFLSLLPNAFFTQSLPQEVESEIERRVSLEINPSISIGVLRPDGTMKFYRYGSIGDQDSKPDSLTLYEIGSVTKTFTATLAHRYLKDSLDKAIADFFPELQNPGLRRITLSGLLNHVAGVPRLSEGFTPDNWSDPFNGYSNAILQQELQEVKPDTLANWSYSNFGYGILGRTMEISTGKPYDTLLGGLLTSAGMRRTYLSLPAHLHEYIPPPTNLGTGNNHWNFSGPSRYAGGLVSSAKDMLSYLCYQKQTNPLFQTDSISDLIPTGVPNLGKDKLFYKDGWFVFQPDSTTQILLHNGGTGGYISFLGYNKNTKVGVVVLSNSVQMVDDLGIKIMYPSFEMQHPERTIAYELADTIDSGESDNLLAIHNRLKGEAYPNNIIDTYWLERYHFGKGHYEVSHQLSEILVQELPEDWEVHDINGQNLEKLKAYREAKRAYERALALNPDNALMKEKLERCEALSTK